MQKAELHVHIEGSFESEMMLKLAERNKITLPYKSVEDIQSRILTVAYAGEEGTSDYI